ncbi:MAG TPA: hypothetical protein VGL45_21785 [Bradyrhizobium sp.]
MVWALNTQLGQVLPGIDCQRHLRFSAIASIGGMLLAGLAAGLSAWPIVRNVNTANRRTCGGRTWDFVGRISALAALVFAFALAMQGLAGLVLDGCER